MSASIFTSVFLPACGGVYAVCLAWLREEEGRRSEAERVYLSRRNSSLSRSKSEREADSADSVGQARFPFRVTFLWDDEGFG